VVHNPARAREVAAGAIREAAVKMNNPPDLINVALETLVSQSLELPGFTTLDEMAARVAGHGNAAEGGLAPPHAGRHWRAENPPSLTQHA
jgi:Domain of unknown function (DUF4158)